MSTAVDVLVAGIGPLPRRVRSALAGIDPASHIALTYDDGPDPASTLAASELLLTRWAATHAPVGPLRDHGLDLDLAPA